MRTEIVSCKDYVDIKKKELKEEIKHLYKKPVLVVIQMMIRLQIPILKESKKIAMKSEWKCVM